jgi:hypothetical protein
MMHGGWRVCTPGLVRNLPTDYVLNDACDMELLRVAACWLVGAFRGAERLAGGFLLRISNLT